MLVLILIGTIIILWVWSKKNTNKEEPPICSGSKILIGHALMYAGSSVQLWNTVKIVNKEAVERGGVVKTTIGPRVLYVVTDPEDVTTVANACLYKAHVYEFAKRWVGDGLVTSSGSQWKVHRKIINPAFNQCLLDSFIDTFNSHSRYLVEKLQVEVGKGPFDIIPYTQSCALNIICSTALGVDFREKNVANNEFVKTLSKMFNLTITRFQTAWLHINFLYSLSRLKRKQTECIKILHNFSNTILRQRKKSLWENEEKGPKIKLFMDLLLELARDTNSFTDQEIREHIDTIIIAGHDTSATVLMYCILLIGSYPMVQKKIHDELKNVFGAEDRDITKQDLTQLFYIEAVIKESMRLYPVVPVIGRHLHEDIKLRPKIKLFMDLLLELARDTNSFTDQEIREHIDTIIIAGHDTSATVLMYCILLIGSYPMVQKKIHDELKNVFGAEDRDITKQDLTQLFYIEAVIKESMRLYPVVPVIGRHLHEDIKLRNCILLKGHTALLLISGVNRDSMWGSDVEEFRPERWLDPSTLPDHTYTSASFSIGRRSCIGKTYAMMSLKIIMAHFCRNYIVHGDHTKLTLKLDVILKPFSGHHITIEKRNRI